MNASIKRLTPHARRTLRLVTILAVAWALCPALANAPVARAEMAVDLTGPKEYKSWLYQSGKLGAVIAVRIVDPKYQVATVKWCLDFGGDKAGCKKRSPESLGWKAPGGWAGDIRVKGGRLAIQSCKYVDETKPKVALIVQAFDGDGVRIAKGRHVMTQTCNG